MIIATSIDVERTFSQGCLLLSHVRNQLSTQTAQALMCLGDWSRMGLVCTVDLEAVTTLSQVAEMKGNEDGDVLMPENYADI